MLIAEAEDVRHAYPNVPYAAVTHLMWALHRALDQLTYGMDAVTDVLRTDLARYPGNVADLAALGVEAIFRAAAAGPDALTAILGELRLLRPESGQRRYVVVGDLLTARLWARQRRIGYHLVVPVRTSTDCRRLATLNARQVTVVGLTPAGDALLAAALDRLVADGARIVGPSWWPEHSPDPDPDRPRTDFSAARTG